MNVLYCSINSSVVDGVVEGYEAMKCLLQSFSTSTNLNYLKDLIVVGIVRHVGIL